MSDEPRRERLATQITASTNQRIRAATVGMQRRVDPGYTLAQLVDEALRSYVTRLEKEHNDGQAWPQLERLRPGRRVSPRRASDGDRSSETG
ncbi:hypothetical protein [Luteipulveratus halotolerans]|uniref:Centromere-binding protein ParB C-terminal domain-containing protein n=1 Tax=Luteipulveratus halotolerans TaxID=1631356 RepID=A0A0L6CEJ9_9MICO|nr:hypothetical protein [Luteipulveratus halotolerans]KNX35933.1 hypothetical protein VV01_22015 [Luteipulveratus halotolerans]